MQSSPKVPDLIVCSLVDSSIVHNHKEGAEMAVKRGGKAEGQVDPTTVVSRIPPEVEALLNTMAQQIAQVKLQSELETYIQRWIRWILQSNDPEHEAIRAELIARVSVALAAKTLSECLNGAIADQKQAFLTASEKSA